MDKIIIQNVISFYKFLYLVLSCRELNDLTATAVVKMYERIKDLIAWKVDFSVEFLQKLHTYCSNGGGEDKDFENVDFLAKSAFKDLAKYLRDTSVRQAVDFFISVSGNDSNTTLFACITNVRHFGDDYAVVTLVVNSDQGLKDLLAMNKKIEQVYLV
ncbi:MAG: hypothetical protein WC827_02075 [Candidatus Paceibacterota bacterium]|jgi:hypothetical protein